MMPEIDRELVEKARRGDDIALETLFRAHEASLYRYLRILCNEEAMAQELYQETWLRVSRWLGSGKKVERFRAWLFTIAANLYRDELRRRRFARLLRQETEDLDSLPSPAGGEFSDLRHALEKALATLSLRQKRAVVLCYIEGHKIAQAAEILGAAEGTIKATLFKAVRLLRRRLEADGYIGPDEPARSSGERS